MTLLLCTDLDRTVVPNGPEPESPDARAYFRRLAQRPEVTLVYVTGRHEALIHDVMEEYDLPMPDYAIGDVGTTIYETGPDGWHAWQPWAERIQEDWRGMEHEQIAGLLTEIDGLRPQEPGQQGRFKVSYYAPADADRDSLLDAVHARLRPSGVEASLIWSVDELEGVGLLDVLPERATKVHAIRFLMESTHLGESEAVFAGDSGNDLPALTSGLPAILVRNARDEVREEAVRIAGDRGLRDRLYLATGGFHSMNGNYSAGVLEGVAHFHPAAEEWMGLGPC